MKRRFTAFLLTAALLLPLVSCAGTDDGKLIINEVMPKNTAFLTDAAGDTPDWVELFNPGTTDVSLKGWFLSDNELDPDKYPLPDVTVKAGCYRVVFCDGRDCYDPAADEIHASFNLSGKGETLYLLSRNGRLDKLEVSEALSDLSFGRTDTGDYRWFAVPTPNAKNGGATAEDPADLLGKTETKLLITEYSHANAATLPAPDGGYYGFVTVTNITDETVNLAGYCLSDSLKKPEKWHFSAGTLAPNETLTVWCSGKDTATDTNFKLNSSDTALTLSLAGTVVQTVALTIEPEGIARVADPADPAVWRYRSLAGGEPSDTLDGVLRRGVYINEVSATKGNGASEKFDWIELYNAGTTDVDLSGWSLSDQSDDRQRFTFADAKIKAGSYLLLYAAGGEKTGSRYVDFKLNAAGETLFLTDKNGVTVDVFTTGKLINGVSSGRVQGKDRVFFAEPTPGKQNASKGYSSYALTPVLSQSGGETQRGTTVTVLSEEGGVTLRYTTDGSLPTSSSPVFSSLTVQKTTVLRVRAFAPDKLPSSAATATYLVGETHDIPVVCLTASPDDLFSNDRGIFAYGYNYSSSFPYSGANFWKDWEREANFEYMVDGREAIGSPVGIKVFGQYSRAYSQKSVAVYFRSDYGAESVSYPFFADSDHDTLQSLVLRAGGQDQGYTRIRDAFSSQVMKGNNHLVYQEWQPVAVYINGEYWGLYDLREKINADWLSRYGDVDGDNLDLIKGNKTAKQGTNESYVDLLDFVKSHDLSNDENYKKVAARVDIDNYIDYLITEIFFCNGDTGNVKFYRERSDSGKWRWIMFDFDMTLRNEALWNNYNMFEKLFNPAGHGAGNSFSSALQCGLLKNKTFKQKFIDRFSELLNSNFTPAHMRTVLDGMIAQIDSEMTRHCARWQKPDTYAEWKKEVENLYRIVDGRRDHVKKQLIAYFKLSDSEVNRLFPDD